MVLNPGSIGESVAFCSVSSKDSNTEIPANHVLFTPLRQPTTIENNVYKVMAANMIRRIFSREEKSLLASLIAENSVIIESKKTDATSILRKTKKWKEITEKFNANANVQRRTTQQLRTCWKNLKVKARKYINSERRSQVKTGGGPPDVQPASQAVLPPKMYEPIDTDVGDDEPLPLAGADETHGTKQDDAVITQHCDIVEDDKGEILNGIGEGTSSYLLNSRPHSSLSLENDVSRPHSRCSSRNESYSHQYQTLKKVAAKNVEKSCELDVQLLYSKIKTEQLTQDAVAKKNEYYDLKMRCAKLEEEKLKNELLFQEEKHKKELLLLDEKLKCINKQI